MDIAVLSFDPDGDHAPMAASLAVYVPERLTVKHVHDHATSVRRGCWEVLLHAGCQFARRATARYREVRGWVG